jgi:hypothetical protein
MTLFDVEIIFGLTVTDVLNIVLGVLIIAGLLYSVFYRRRETDMV